MNRIDVYGLINEERDYQENVWGDSSEENRSVGDYLILLDYYVRLGQDKYVQNKDGEAALNEIRKIAALAVACMEVHDAPSRRSLPFRGV